MDTNLNTDLIEKIVKECITVIEATNLADRTLTTYDTSLVEFARQRFISNLEKRFNMKNGIL